MSIRAANPQGKENKKNMPNNDTRAVAIGLVIIILIVLGIVYGNNEYVKPIIAEVNALSLVVQDKDVEIQKLIKRFKASELELATLKASLGEANKKLESIKDTVNNGQ